MKSITLMPYTKVDGIPTFRNSELSTIYTRAFEEGWGLAMFDDGIIKEAEGFVEHVTSPTVMFWGVLHEDELMGFCYINRIEKTHGHLHFGFFKKWWGRYPEIMEAGRKAMETLLVQEFNGKPLFELLLGVYPAWNKHVLAYVHRQGAKTVTHIPNLVWSESKGYSVPGTIVSITREDLKWRCTQE